MRGAFLSRLTLAIWCAIPLGILAILTLVPGGLAGAPVDSGPGAGRLARLCLNTIFVSTMSALLASVVALPVALVVARSAPGWRRTVLCGFAVFPLFVSPGVIALAAIRLFGAKGFVFDAWLALLHFLFDSARMNDAIREAPVYTLGGTVLCLAWAWSPVAFLSQWAGFRVADPDMEEAARLELGPTAALWRVVVPSARGGIALGAGLVFLLSMTEFSIPEALRGQPLLVTEVYTQFGVYYDPGAASGAALLVVLATLPLLALLLRSGLLDRDVLSVAVPNTGRHSLPRWLSMLGWLCGVVPAVALIGVLLVTSIGPGGFAKTISETWIITREEFYRTMVLCTVAAAICALVGLVLGLLLAGRSRPLPWRILCMVGFLLPGPVAGIAIKMAMLQPPGSLPLGLDDFLANLDSTTLPLLFAWVVRFGSLSALLIEFQVRAVPMELRMAPLLEAGVTRSAAATWALPTLLPAVCVAFLCSFALVLGEGGAALLLIPPGPTTLAVRLLTLMHYAPTAQVAALCLFTAAPAIVLVPILFSLLHISPLENEPDFSKVVG